ncbi:MAG TPA: response regulator [Tepidisphaeraceae bacterium]|jgi:CheY-like chemotaxis protein|nr:response regulator [Tepidisphaeraceae bacterium]
MAGRPVSILLAEDDRDTLKVFSRLLRHHGYVVHPAASVAEAKALAAENQCDLVISDLGLSDGSGETLMRDLKQQYGLRGLAVSGYAMPDDLAAARTAGFDRFISKPVEFSHLLDTIRELTDGLAT